MNERTIANEILRQITTMGGMITWSWGMSAKQIVPVSMLNKWNFTNPLGGLKFKVNGHHHKGHVVVSLNSNDTYQVSICSIRKGEIKEKKRFDNVYFDQLVDIIDTAIERIDSYRI